LLKHLTISYTKKSWPKKASFLFNIQNISLLTRILLYLSSKENNNLKINIMGKGDKKTKRGKIFSGSFGKRRPRKHFKTIADIQKNKAKKKEATTPKTEDKPAVKKETKAKAEKKSTPTKKTSAAQTTAKSTAKKTTTKKTAAKKTTAKKTTEKKEPKEDTKEKKDKK